MIDLFYQILASIGFYHPIHPAVTHIPMGMAIGGFLFGIAYLWLKREDLLQTMFYCYLLGLVFVPPTMLAGYMDWQHRFDAEWSGLILLKIILGITLCILLATAAYMARRKDTGNALRLVIQALCLLNAIALGYSGGELQYG